MSQPQWIIDFEERNGAECVQVDDWLFYPNGAAREISAYGSWHEPPSNELECLRNKLIFAKRTYELSAEAFEDRRRSLEWACESDHMPPDFEFERLESMQKQVKRDRRKFTKIKKQIHNHPQNVARRKSDASANEAKAEAKARLSKLRI